MDPIVLLVALVAIGIWLFMPLRQRDSSRVKSKKYRTSGAILFGINEVFAPSAANASIIQQEKRESSRAIPAPEDKLL